MHKEPLNPVPNSPKEIRVFWPLDEAEIVLTYENDLPHPG